MRFGKPKFTPLQRRSVSLIGASLGTCAFLNLSLREIPPNRFSAATYFGIALLGAFPVILALVAVGRYLVGETDEYLRSLAVRSILWGFGLVMCVDTLLGYTIAFQSVLPDHLRSLGVFNLEIFTVASAIAFRIQLRSDR